ncbi:hypothetical protein A4G99_05185 [Haladaptatus sp. R4]|uniref:hypothetical protein n=1 Tax=Haladaptatus sp. R4 TaxID=1679489 RepID=UPI0007B4E51A|nr:hypothetical protein [Haladaptatus sp. R4]KZN25815.1 hypothetical protein A4G99_05185 [Haladaptatus sp. R4]
MIEWEETETGVRAFDRTKTGVTIDALDWKSGGETQEIEPPIDELVPGYASELTFPSSLVKITEIETEEQYEHGNDTESLELPEGEYLANIHGNVKTYLRFSGGATVRKTEDFEDLIIDFHERLPITFGFRSHHEVPLDTITIPPTTDGLATAISYASSSHKATGPDRSYPTLRGHPPRFEVGDELNIPEPVRAEKKDVGIEIRVPDDFRTLFVTAPLAYYLQADVIVENRDAPELSAPEVNFTYSFSPLPSYQHEVADMLRRVFFMDCLVRNEGPYSWDLAELSLLDEIDMDTEETYEATPAEQLVTYSFVDFECIDDGFPDWHLSMYVEPSLENVSSLPYLLSNLSLIYLPESSDLQKNELLDISLGDFYRGNEQPTQSTPRAVPTDESYRTTDRVHSVDRVMPELQRGQIHGWLADGVPIDVFKVEPSAYENRFKYLEQSEGENIGVTLILNDETMEEEHEDVAEIYLERAENLPIEVTVREHLSRVELAETLETPCDFVHYIGHCEASGLRCTDGNLSVKSIEQSNVQTFFLNACGSYFEGMELIRKGSVAGAVTFNKVLNKQAGKVGVSFARLLINGFSIQRALQIARRRIMMNKDYAVVGDGTHQLAQSDNFFPTVGEIIKLNDGSFQLLCNAMAERLPGGYYQINTGGNNKVHLGGNSTDYKLDRVEIADFLTNADFPIVYDGELYWSAELAPVFS